MFLHATFQGFLALIMVVFLFSGYTGGLTTRATSNILNFIGIKSNYVNPFLLHVRLLDGTFLEFHITIEYSGLIFIAIFAAISTFTIGLLKGSVLAKTVWFLASTGIGLMWNLNRLVLVIAIAYNFGISVSSFVHYFLIPLIDFLWVVSMWSIGMSLIKGGRKKNF